MSIRWGDRNDGTRPAWFTFGQAPSSPPGGVPRSVPGGSEGRSSSPYLAALANVTGAVATHLTFVPVTLADAADIGDMEATDVVLVGDRIEQIDIGGGGIMPRTYARISAPDLLHVIDAARRLLDQAEAAVIEARQEREESRLAPCPYCRVLRPRDAETCGNASCERELEREERRL